jgi:DNA invertase Pin-like site-specific DNA recombinase
MILDRVSQAKRRARGRGRHVHGRIPYGYRSAREGKLETVPELERTVRRIFTLAKRGDSPRWSRNARAFVNADAENEETSRRSARP